MIRRAPGGSARFSEHGFAVDYEVEFGVVIGTTARHVRREDAMDHVFGYTIFNDVGARSVQFHNGQRDLAKNFETFCPMGPWIVTRDELPDWEGVRIESHVNGELRQRALVKEQIGPPPVAIEWLSSVMRLNPGDCLMTGTPAGCGTFMDPPRFLVPGDIVTCSASGIGELTNPVVAGSAPAPIDDVGAPVRGWVIPATAPARRLRDPSCRLVLDGRPDGRGPPAWALVAGFTRS